MTTTCPLGGRAERCEGPELVGWTVGTCLCWLIRRLPTVPIETFVERASNRSEFMSALCASPLDVACAGAFEAAACTPSTNAWTSPLPPNQVRGPDCGPTGRKAEHSLGPPVSKQRSPGQQLVAALITCLRLFQSTQHMNPTSYNAQRGSLTRGPPLCSDATRSRGASSQEPSPAVLGLYILRPVAAKALQQLQACGCPSLSRQPEAQLVAPAGVLPGYHPSSQCRCTRQPLRNVSGLCHPRSAGLNRALPPRHEATRQPHPPQEDRPRLRRTQRGHDEQTPEMCGRTSEAEAEGCLHRPGPTQP